MSAAILLAGYHVLSALRRLRRFDPTHPAVLWSVPFAITTTLFAFNLLPYRSITAATVLLICATTFVLGIGTRLPLPQSPWVERPSLRRLVPHAVFDRDAVCAAALLSLLALTAWLVAFLAQISAEYGLRNALVTSPEVRQDLATGTATLTIKYVYLTLSTAGLCALAAAQATSRRQRRLWLGGAVGAAASAYFSTGRSNVVLPILVAVVVYGVARGGQIRRRTLLGVGAAAITAVLAVFTVGGQIIGKTLENNPLAQVSSVLTSSPALQPLALPYQYATAPLAAFDVQLRVANELPRTDGCATFSVACQVMAAAGLPTAAVDRIRPFTSDPMPWNTYTALDLPLLDAGWVGVLVFFFAIGAVLGELHRRAKAGHSIATLAYGIFSSAVLYAPVQNNFFAPHIVGALMLAPLALMAAARLSSLAARWRPSVRLDSPRT